MKEHHVHQRHFDRLVMLSDGVFAIALTLSAVELHPQALPGQSLLQVWARPLAVYFLSFFLIGVVWLRHRRTLAHLYRVDAPVTVATLVLLSLVALVPVFIRVLLEDQNASSNNGMLVYALSLMAIYVCLAIGWGYAAFIRHLAPSVAHPRAWGWLLEDLFIAVFFAAAALYSLHWHVLALLATLIGVGMRFNVSSLEKKAKALDEQALEQAGSHDA
ncbi:TMEM175 family protein [Dyella jejuensis]|uniref:TMEM175 family protein n=1 Tax=Dyella jejuensis TaxID=1432009 RepID=UPI00384AA217